MKKKKYLLCGVAILSVLSLTGFSGSKSVLPLTGVSGSKNVSITKSIQNTKNIKTAKVETMYSVALDDEYTLTGELNGIVKNEVLEGQTTGTKFSGEIIRHMDNGETDMKIPIMLDTNPENIEGTDVFINPPKHLLEMMDMEGIDTIYINSVGLQKVIDGETEELYKIPTKNKEKFVSIFENLVKENPEIVEFTEIKGKKIAENGIYTFSLNKNHIKSIYAELMKSDDTIPLNEKNIGVNETPLDLYDPTEILDDYEDISIKVDVTIENELITQLKIIAVEQWLSVKEVRNIDIKYTNLEEDVQINMPDRSAKNVLNVMDMLDDSSETLVVETDNDMNQLND